MKKNVKPIPDGFHTVTPYLIVKGAARAIDFYKKAFGARERYRFPGPDGRIGHAEIIIGNSILMLADEFPQFDCHSPQTLKGTPVSFTIYVKDADAAFKKAVRAGARVKQPVEDKFYGERAGCVRDPFGHHWTLMTHIEDLTVKEVTRRMQEFCAKLPPKKKGK